MEDLDLINSALTKGDEEAWRFIYNRYYGVIKWSFLKFGSVGPEQDDLAQLTFLKMFNAKSKPKFDNLRSFHSWLKTTVRSVFLDKAKSKAACTAADTDYLDDIAELNVVCLQEPTSDEYLNAKVEKALNALSEKEKKLVQLRVNGTPFSMIAIETGISQTGIRVYYHRAITKLKKQLQSEGLIK